MSTKFKYALIIPTIVVIFFLCIVVVFAIPFATIYLIALLFKKQPPQIEEKQPINFFDFAIKNFKKDGI